MVTCHRSNVMTEVVSDVGLVQRTEQRCTMHDGRWHDGMGDGGGWWFLMLIMMIAFWGGLIWLGITLVRHNHHAPPTTPPAAGNTTQRSSAHEILAERLARGEIDADDYRRRIDVLRETSDG